jgi:small-conductance mechanosensitive channel
MQNSILAISHWLLPLAIAIGGFVFGFLVQKLIINRLKVLLSKTNWKAAKILVNCLDGINVLWFGIFGIYTATMLWPMNAKLLKLLHEILLVVALSSVTWFISKLSVSFIEEQSFIKSARAQSVLPSSSILKNITRASIFAIGVLVIANSLGVSITPLITALGVGGIAVSLALQDTLSNLFAGVYIVASKQIRLGDYVRLESGEEGFITDINWRNTSVRELSNNTVIVPNAKLSSAIIKNYYLPESEMAVLLEMAVSYDSDLEKVEQVTMKIGNEIMKKVSGGIPGFSTFIRFHDFDDYSIKYSVILRASKFDDQFLVKHEFIKSIQKAYQQEGIKIPAPIHEVDIKEPIKYQITPLKVAI